MRNGGRTAETLEKTAAERPKRGKRLKRWKIGGRTAKTWNMVRTEILPCGREFLHFSAARQKSCRAAAVYPSFTSRRAGDPGGAEFPGYIGGEVVEPPWPVGNGYRPRLWAKRGHSSGIRWDIHRSRAKPTNVASVASVG